MFSDQFYEKWLSVRRKEYKIVTWNYHLHNCITVTFLLTETVTCIITIETVMSMMYCRKYHPHNCKRDSYLRNYNKKCHPRICCRNCHLHKVRRKDGKTFVCYTIGLKFWGEFSVSFVLLYFSSYRSIKTLHFYLKNVKKNNKAVHLRLFFTYLHQNRFNIRKHFVFVLKKNYPVKKLSFTSQNH